MVVKKDNPSDCSDAPGSAHKNRDETRLELEKPDLPVGCGPSNDAGDLKDTSDDHSASGKSETDVDRPGFDLGGSTGKTDAGKGLGLGDDSKRNKTGWRLPR